MKGLRTTRILSLVLCALLAVAVLNGCAAQPTATPQVTSTPTPREVVTIRMMQNWVTLDNAEGIANDRIKKAIEDKLSIKLEIISPAEGYYDKLNTYLSTGDAPDIINDAFDATFVVKAAEEGLLFDLGAAVAKNPAAYPTLQFIFKDNLQKFLNEIKFKDSAKNLAIWSMSGVRNPWAGAVVYNGKIMKDLGLTVPTTVEGYIQLLRDIKAKNPSIIPMGARVDKGNLIAILSPVFFRSYGVDPLDLVLQGGSYVDTSTSDQAKACWKQVQQLYKEGLIDPEIITNELQTVYDNFGADKYATLMTNQPGNNGGGFSWLYGEFLKSHPNAVPGVDLLVDQKPLTGPAGPANQMLAEMDVAGSNTVIFGNSKVADRSLELLEYMLSDEGQTLKWFGVEGVHYTKDAQGNITRNVPEFMKEVVIYYPGETVRLEWNPFSDLTAQLYFQFSKAKDLKDAIAKAVPIINDSYVTDDAIGHYAQPVGKAFEDAAQILPVYETLANNYFTADQTTVKAKVEDTKKQWYAAFLVGQKDVDEEWANFVQAVKDAGGDQVVQYKNENVGAVKAIYDKYFG